MSQGALNVGVLVVLVVLCGVALAGAVGTAGATEHAENTSSEANETTSLGADISSFMQASTVEATDEVDDGTFEVRINRTSDAEERKALIEQRRERLEDRKQRLEAQREGLGDVDDVRNRSVAARVSAGANGLEHSTNGTERAAERAGVDVEGLGDIRSAARNLRGPDVAESARENAGPPGAVELEPRDRAPENNRTNTSDSSVDERSTSNHTADERADRSQQINPRPTDPTNSSERSDDADRNESATDSGSSADTRSGPPEDSGSSVGDRGGPQTDRGASEDDRGGPTPAEAERPSHENRTNGPPAERP